MSEAASICLPPRVAKFLALLVGGYAVTPFWLIFDVVTLNLFNAFGYSALRPDLAQIGHTVLNVALYLGLGWFIPRAPLFQWLVAGLLLFQGLFAFVVYLSNTPFDASGATPFEQFQAGFGQVALYTGPVLIALFAGSWLRRRFSKPTSTPPSPEVSA